MGQRSRNLRAAVLSSVRFPIKDLPEIREMNDFVFAGEWSFDPTEDPYPEQAWAAAKAWAAYALWLEAR